VRARVNILYSREYLEADAELPVCSEQLQRGIVRDCIRIWNVCTGYMQRGHARKFVGWCDYILRCCTEMCYVIVSACGYVRCLARIVAEG
jgi:hypothetical protein